MYDNLDQAWSFYQQRGSKRPKIKFLHFDSGAEGSAQRNSYPVLQKDMPFLGRLDAAGTSALLGNH